MLMPYELHMFSYIAWQYHKEYRLQSSTGLHLNRNCEVTEKKSDRKGLRQIKKGNNSTSQAADLKQPSHSKQNWKLALYK